MNLQEFKAWFEGFTENMSGVPSAKAWARIKARVGEITEKPTEVRYFYDNYWRPYWHYVPTYARGITYSSANGIDANVSSYTHVGTNDLTATSLGVGFENSSQAFTALGRADSMTLEQ